MELICTCGPMPYAFKLDTEYSFTDLWRMASWIGWWILVCDLDDRIGTNAVKAVKIKFSQNPCTKIAPIMQSKLQALQRNSLRRDDNGQRHINKAGSGTHRGWFCLMKTFSKRCLRCCRSSEELRCIQVFQLSSTIHRAVSSYLDQGFLAIFTR